ncbi:MAG TPA: glycosyltransferase family 39 protein [Thermomicrobiales bacterium]|nr:glycosyltransferase family 39 protein [Thermomicrobiales bacterium]
MRALPVQDLSRPPGDMVAAARISAAEWIWVATAMLLGLALRIPFFRMPMLADEGGYAYATRGWVEGTGQLYDDLWISRPQGIFFVYAGILDLFGTGTVAFRFAAWIAIALTTLAIWGFVRIWRASPVTSVLAAILFAVMSSLPNLEGYTANSEMFMGCPVAVAMLWLLWIGRNGCSRWQLTGTGILLGIAISLKPSAATMVPVALAFILLVADPASIRIRLARCGWVVFGVAVAGILSLVHGWILGWDDFVYATITYRLHAQSAATVGLGHNIEAIGRLSWRAGSLVALTILLLLLKHRHGIASLARRIIRRPIPNRHDGRRRPIRHDDGRLLLVCWLVAAIIGASIGGDWWSHYLIQVVAPLAIWMAATIAVVWPSLRWWLQVPLAIAVVALLLNPFLVIRFGTPERMAEAMFSHPGYPAQADVAAWLRENSKPGTTIYVAFDQASIYYMADLPPAYRHLYDQELRGIPSSYADLIAIIQGPDRPRYIVATRQPGPFADDSRAFWQEVGVYYEIVTTIDGVPIYQDRSTIETGP